MPVGLPCPIRYFKFDKLRPVIMRCSNCNKEAIILQRYNGLHLCKKHFTESVRKRVYGEFQRQVKLRGGEHIAIAYSGGKDSTLALYLTNEILKPMRKVTRSAIIIDEGIAGYRDKGLPIARKFCRELGINLMEMSMSQHLGTTLDEIARLPRSQSTCTYCGVFRRRLMNKAARELGADYLVTGLNLDDTAQGIVMNIFRGDIEKLARMGPHENIQEGLVPRLQPLRKIPEKESLLFCIVEGLTFYDGVCPYAHEAVRNAYREMIAKMEEDFPGTRYSILSSYDSIREALRASFPPIELNRCACGEPSVNEKCKACQLLEEINRKKRRVRTSA
ncbi:MAG: TIGR00269 family protein [Thermoplasmata archaeon]